MKKIILLLLVVLFTIPVTGCTENAVLEESYVYTVQSHIHSLEIEVGAANFTIQPADTFSVESNLKYLSISEENGVLRIIDEKTVGVTYDNPVLILNIPDETVFDTVSISTGAANLTASSLHANTLTLQLGAGEAELSHIRVASLADITGGAGEITITDASIRNLNAIMGVGELKLSAALLGSSHFSFGVGNASLTLIGSKDEYDVHIEKGLGSITVDGAAVSDFDGSRNGQHHVEIDGGVGSIDLSFQELTIHT